MTSLAPAHLWKFKKYSGDVPAEYHPDWYPTESSLKFLSEHEAGCGRARSMADAWLQYNILKARKDPNAFIELIFSGFELDEGEGSEWMHQGWLHKEIQRFLNYGTRGMAPDQVVALHRRLAIAVPRGVGKTTQVVIGRVIWEIGHNPDISVMIVSESDSIATKRVQEIKGHIERNPWVRLVFPHLKPGPKEQWTNTRIIVDRPTIKKDATVEGAGILSSGTGNRCSLLIGDDVVGRRNALTQKKLLSEVKKAWYGLWQPMLTKGGREWFIFTPWHHDDLCHDYVKRDDVTTLFASVTQEFQTLWPERWSQEDLRELYTSSTIKSEFARAYFLEASDANDSPIDADRIEFFDPADISSEGIVFALSCDLAIGKKKEADFFAMIVSAIDVREKQAYVLDYFNGHLGVSAQLEKIREWTTKYNGRWVIVETIAYQEALAEMLRDKFGRWPEVISFKPTVDKRLRMELAAAPLESGVVKLNKKLDDSVAGSKPLLMQQIRNFGITPHDDVSDALTQFVIWLIDKLRMEKRSTLKAYTLG